MHVAKALSSIFYTTYKDHHTYMHVDGPKRDTSIDRSTDRSDDITANLAHSW